MAQQMLRKEGHARPNTFTQRYMNAKSEQMLSLYEVEGLSVEEIAEGMTEDVGLVKGFLQGSSKLYQQRVSKGAEEDVSREVAAEAITVLTNIMRQEKEPAGARLKAAIYVREEHFGRNEARARKDSRDTNVGGIVTLFQALNKLQALRQQELEAKYQRQSIAA